MNRKRMLTLSTCFCLALGLCNFGHAQTGIPGSGTASKPDGGDRLSLWGTQPDVLKLLGRPIEASDLGADLSADRYRSTTGCPLSETGPKSPSPQHPSTFTFISGGSGKSRVEAPDDN
ncbi:MAG: hypothetical protein HQK60_15780 [Deltaproteobacteria bacterium]|nr:hypothetical protein [Deltaproteobacteria bacterium]